MNGGCFYGEDHGGSEGEGICLAYLEVSRGNLMVEVRVKMVTLFETNHGFRRCLVSSLIGSKDKILTVSSRQRCYSKRAFKLTAKNNRSCETSKPRQA